MQFQKSEIFLLAWDVKADSMGQRKIKLRLNGLDLDMKQTLHTFKVKGTYVRV